MENTTRNSMKEYCRLFIAPNAEIHILESRCKGCGYCVEFCPEDVLKLSEKTNKQGHHIPRVNDKKKCNLCKTCEILCPDFAIFITEKKRPLWNRKVISSNSSRDDKASVGSLEEIITNPIIT